MGLEKQNLELSEGQETNRNSRQQPSAETRLREMMGYFTYYSGSVINYNLAVLMIINAELINRSLGGKPIAVEAKELMDVGAIRDVVKGTAKLGRLNDVGSNLRFTVVGHETLAMKPVPEKLLSEPFNKTEKEALDRTLISLGKTGISYAINSRVNRKIREFRELFPEKESNKAWGGFDPVEARSIAPLLKDERMASLPKYESLSEDKGSITKTPWDQSKNVNGEN